jgi:hypothetical protein
MLDTNSWCESAAAFHPALVCKPAVSKQLAQVNPRLRIAMKRIFLRHGWLALLPLVLVVGCQGYEDIRNYTVDKPEDRPDPRSTATEKMRLMGAIVPVGRESWFFKFLGPASAVDEHAEEFSKLVGSLKRSDRPDAPLTWTLPQGWKEGPGDQFRFAILHLGPDGSLEVGISKTGGSLTQNVDRWRGQLGLRPLESEAALREKNVIRNLNVNNMKIVLVDMTSFRLVQGAPPGGVKELDVKYNIPKGWERAQPPSEFTSEAFRLPDSTGKAPEVTITPLAGDAGGLLMNLNRWRKQVGLQPLENLVEDLKTITVAGEPCKYIDLVGPAGPEQQRLLAVVCKKGGKTWFFKLQAPANLAATNQDAFEAFVKSVRFDAAGAKP